MSLRKPFAAVAGLALLASCALVERQPADPAVVSQIVAACLADGVFVMFGGRLVLAGVDPTKVAAPILAAGVDKVCANPEAFAADIATAAWVAKNIKAVLTR